MCWRKESQKVAEKSERAFELITQGMGPAPIMLVCEHASNHMPDKFNNLGLPDHLLESHIAFHTWPTEGVITLDLFTCGSTSLLDTIPLIEDLFAVPKKNKKSEQPKVLWAYKRRGFKEQFALSGSRDTFAYPLGLHGLENKKEVSICMHLSIGFSFCSGI